MESSLLQEHSKQHVVERGYKYEAKSPYHRVGYNVAVTKCRATQIAENLISASKEKRIDIENALIAEALSEQYNQDKMNSTPELKLEWTMFMSVVRSGNGHASVKESRTYYVLVIGHKSEFHLPYSKDGILVGKALMTALTP